MKKTNIKHILCLALSTTVIMSLGVTALADETEISDEDILIEEEAEETEYTEEDIFTEDIEDETDSESVAEEETLIEETEEVEIISEEADIEEVEALGDGWQFEDGDWYYYVDGEPVTGWYQIKNEWYYFDKYFGAMYTGLFLDSGSGERYLFDENGHMLRGWQEYDDEWYYFGKGGKAVKGWQTINNKKYYFDDDCCMYSGFCKIGEDWYCFKDNGEVVSGWYYGSDNYWHYADSTGKVVKYWKKINKKWYFFGGYSGEMYRSTTYYDSEKEITYFFGDDGAMITNGWYQSTDYFSYGRWFYIGSDGTVAKGWQKINGKWYYFGNPEATGSYQTNFYMRDGLTYVDGVYYYFKNGVMQTGWVTIGDEERFFESDGKALTGWKKIDGTWYYLRNGEILKDRSIIEIGDDYYGFDENGRYRTGWYSYWSVSNYVWVYYGSDGKAAIGWTKIDGKWYYFSHKADFGFWCVEMRTGIVEFVSGDSYYFGESGAMQTGWIKNGNKYYYANDNGTLVKDSWKKINGKWYYFDGFSMVTGLYELHGVLYHFDSNGVCLNP